MFFNGLARQKPFLNASRPNLANLHLECKFAKSLFHNIFFTLRPIAQRAAREFLAIVVTGPRQSGKAALPCQVINCSEKRMADRYNDYTREELIRLLRERDRKPKFGLVWERDEIEHERAINEDFVALDFDAGLSCGEAPFGNLIIRDVPK